MKLKSKVDDTLLSDAYQHLQELTWAISHDVDPDCLDDQTKTILDKCINHLQICQQIYGL